MVRHRRPPHRLRRPCPGQGPGEFGRPTALSRAAGDTVAVFDETNFRLTYFAPDGTLVRVVRLEGDTRNPDLVGVFADGSTLSEDFLFRIPEMGFAESQMHVTRHGPDGLSRGRIGQFPQRRIGLLGSPDGGMIGSPLFEGRASVAIAPHEFWVGLTREYEVAAYDTAGALRRVVRWQGPDRSVRPNDVDRANADELASAGADGREQALRFQAARTVAERFPAYESILTSRSGLLAVVEHRRPLHTGPNRWLVFDAEGRLIARLSIPEAIERVLDWDRDYLLIVAENDAGVEQVRRYAIER